MVALGKKNFFYRDFKRVTIIMSLVFGTKRVISAASIDHEDDFFLFECKNMVTIRNLTIHSPYLSGIAQSV